MSHIWGHYFTHTKKKRCESPGFEAFLKLRFFFSCSVEEQSSDAPCQNSFNSQNNIHVISIFTGTEDKDPSIKAFVFTGATTLFTRHGKMQFWKSESLWLKPTSRQISAANLCCSFQSCSKQCKLPTLFSKTCTSFSLVFVLPSLLLLSSFEWVFIYLCNIII